MENRDRSKYIFISITLVIAIIALIIIVIIPKLMPATSERLIEKIDFSTSDWIEGYVEKSVGIYGMDFFVNAAFTYNIRSNKMIVTYASQKSVEEARDNYLTLPGAELTGRNDETSLNITAKNNGQKIQIYNYYSLISRVFELELTLESSQAEQIINQLEMEYPLEEIAKIGEIKDLIAGDIFGGYVRYRYDSLDEFSYPNIPIFSRAYKYDGNEEDFINIINALTEDYSNHKYEEIQDTHYFRINGQIMSLGFFVTDLDETIVSISLQEDNKQE